MTKRSKILLVSSPLLFAGMAAAQFGGVVFDPTVTGKVIAETAEIVRVYTAAMNTYNQLRMDARILTSKSIFRMGSMQTLTSFFGSSPVTDQWARTALNGLGAASAYGTAAVALKANPGMMVPGSPFAAHYATAQIGIASGKQGLQALGNANQFLTQGAAPIQNCQNAALRTDDSSNTTPSLLGVQAACTAVALQQNQAALQVNSARLQLELLQAKATTDNYAEYANMTTGFDQTLSSTPVVPGDMARTITSYPDR
jgi:hypothetical protein